jgi:hypothetical protein
MTARLLLVLVAIVSSLTVAISAAPKLDVGKVYEVIWSCQTSVVTTPDGPARAQLCFSERLHVVGRAKDDWYDVIDGSGDRWFVNLSRALSVRAVKPAPPEPKIETSDNPRISL